MPEFYQVPVDATPTNGSNNPVSSEGVFDALALKADKLLTGIDTTTRGAVVAADTVLAAIGKLEASKAVALTQVPVANLATGGSIGAAATTVDVAGVLVFAQSTAGQALTLPTPTTTATVLTITLVGGTVDTTVAGVAAGSESITLRAGEVITATWSGSSWAFRGALNAAESTAIRSLIVPIDTIGVSAASANLSAINSALSSVGAAGNHGEVWVVGSGVAFLNGTITQYSNTILRSSPNLTLRQAPGTNKPMWQTGALAATQTPIVSNWTAGRQWPIEWTSHGLIAGDWVWVKGAVEGPFLGVFQVSGVTDANNVVLSIYRTPTANATGSITATKATVNAIVAGFSFDYNYASNGGAAAGENRHGMLMVGAAHSFVMGCEVRNAYSFALLFAATSFCGFSNFRIADTSGSAVKIYGPCKDFSFDGVSGAPGDDLISFQPREADVFSAYRTTFGDIDGVIGKNIHCGRMDAGFKVIGFYCSQNYKLDGVVIEGVSGDAVGGNGVVIVNSAGETSTTAGSIRILGVSLRALTPILVGPPTVDLLEVQSSNLRTVLPNGTAINFQAASNVKKFVLTGHFNDPAYTGGGTWVSVQGNIEHIDISSMQWLSGATGRFIALNNSAVKTVDNINLSNSFISGGDSAFLIQSPATFTRPPCIYVSGCKIDTRGLLNTSANADLVVGGNAFVNANLGVLRTGGAPTVSIHSHGGNRLVAGSWVVVPTGAPVIAVFGWDLQINLGGTTGISKTVPGQHCVNSALSGTLLANRMAACNGTNFFQLDAPANVF
jgi:hypothetical protein